MFAIVQPKAFLYFLSTFNKDSSWPSDRLEDIFMGYDSPSPRNAYLSVEGKGFLLRIGGCSSKGIGLIALRVRDLKIRV